MAPLHVRGYLILMGGRTVGVMVVKAAVIRSWAPREGINSLVVSEKDISHEKRFCFC